MLHPISNNFNGGELSPLVYGRVDLQKYATGAKTLENFIPIKYGPIERARGFEVVFDSAATPAAVTTKGDAVCRLERFRFNTSTNYILAFTDQALRFYKGGTTASQIESAPGTAYEISTPYVLADLFELQIRQINDVMYITHPSYAVRKLSRLSETSWTLTVVAWDFPPLLDENETSVTMYPSATSGSTTIIASSATFTDDMVGGYVAIRQRRDAQELKYTNVAVAGDDLGDASFTSSAIDVKGAWTLTISSGVSGTIQIERSYDGGPWQVVAEASSDLTGGYTVTGNEDEDDVQFRFLWTKDRASAADAIVSFRNESIDITGFALITGRNSDTSVNVTVVKNFVKSGSSEAVTTWSLGAFSDEYGHPRTCTFHQQRLWFASTSNEKQRIWGSQSGDFENFETGADDDDGIAIDLASDQQNEIMWLRSEKRMLAGTSANEWTIGADSLNGAITPSNITALVHTFQGSTTQPAILANKAIFLTRNTKRLQSFFFNFQKDGYDSDEISKLSEHVLQERVNQMAYQQVRDQVVWLQRDDGELVGLVFNEEDNVVAFFRRNNPLVDFESVATIYGTDEDEVWVVAKATIDGNTKRFICRQSARTTVKEDMVFLDLATTLTGASSTSWQVPHLPNATVDVLADGAKQLGVTTDGSGNFTLSSAATKVTVGLPYTSTYRSLNVEAPTGDGTSKGKLKRIVRLDLGLDNSLGGEYGITVRETSSNTDVFKGYERFDRIVGVTPIGSSPALVTGVFPLTMPAGNYKELDVTIRQSDPYPMTVTHTFPVVGTKGD